MTKHVSMRDGQNGALVPLASFHLEDGRVVAVYHEAGYGLQIEQDGIGPVSGSDLKVRPSDGQNCWSVLNASTICPDSCRPLSRCALMAFLLIFCTIGPTSLLPSSR